MHGVVLKNFMIVNELWTKNVFSISYFMNSQCSALAHWREPGLFTELIILLLCDTFRYQHADVGCFNYLPD